MEINITCLLQILHFLIGWYILDRFYFTPALAWLNGIERDEHDVHQKIKRTEFKLAALHAQEQEQKQQFMDYCKKHTIAPQGTPHIILSTLHTTPVPSAISAEQAVAIEQELVERITQKVQE